MNLLQNEAPPILGNPFFHRGPIRDRRYFFGRKAETRRALEMLRHRQCVSIVGPRRIGKTSLLFHLCNPEVQKRYGLGEKYLFVYIDCQGMGDLDKPQFYQWLWKKAKGALEERGKADGWAESISGFSGLREAMMTIQEKEYKPAFLFDEFEYLATSKYVDQALFSLLRNLNQEFKVAYVTASQMPVDELTYRDRSALDSPFFSNFDAVPLGLLKPDEAERMVLGLIKMIGQEDYFSGEDLTFVFEIAGYHPFFLQLACYYLFEQKTGRGELATEDYEITRRQYAEDAERFFRYAWDHLEADEQESIRLVCEEGVSQLNDEQRRRLERQCILQNSDIFSSVFAEFVRKQTGVGLVSQTPVSMPTPKETAQKPSKPRMCQLSITCNKRGWVSVRVVGSLSYEGDSERMLEQRLVDRLDRRAIGALRLPDWRFQVKEIGRELFDELVLNRPEIEKGYQRAVGHVQQATLSLVLHAPRYFLRLPFEALHSEDEGYLCLKYPMYRVVSGCFFDKEPLSTALISQLDSQGERPRALVVASNTWNTRTSPIPGVEEEVRKVSALLRKHGFDVCSLSTDEATEKRVRDELTGGGYLLFHYAGHGAYSPDSPEKGALYFWEGTKGKSKVINLIASQLEILVQKTPLHLVYLSCCWGAHTAPPATLLDDDFLGVMDGLVMGGVPAVLGFRWPVSDDGAQLLAQSFYSAWLDEEKKLDKALYEARRTVADQLGRDERAWFSPILAMRAPGF